MKLPNGGPLLTTALAANFLIMKYYSVIAKDADAFNGELFCRCSAVSAGAVQVSVSLHALQCSTVMSV